MTDQTNTDTTLSTQRLEAFSDSVFAIVLTLLFYNLEVPAINDKSDWRELLTALSTLSPKFLGIILSFIFVAAFWVAHHQFFRTLKQTTRGLLWLNLVFLFLVCFVPFPAGIVTEHRENETAVVFFGATILLTSIMFAVLRYYAWFKHSEISSAINENQIKNALLRSLLLVSLHAATFIVAFFFPSAAIIIFVLVLFVLFFPIKVEIESEPGDDENEETSEVEL